jgi:putative transposase
VASAVSGLDRVLPAQAQNALLERSRDEAGGLRLTGEGSMLGELVKAVPARRGRAGRAPGL